MSNVEKFKTGQTIETTGVYLNDWGITKQLKKGSKFPKDGVMGDTYWKLAHYPFSNQVTSANVKKEYWNEK